MSERFEIEVAYATPDEQVILKIVAEQGITVGDAIKQSRIGERFPDIDLEKDRVGIFGKIAKKDAVLYPGDRVEIYRPLIADPKAARKKRAADVNPSKKGGTSDKA